MADLYKNRVYIWEGDDTQPYPNYATYKTGKVLLPVRKTFWVARVIADTGDRDDYYKSVRSREQAIKRNNARISNGITWNPIIGYDVEVNGDDLETVPTVAAYSGDFYLNVKIYGDGTLLHSKDVYTNNEPWKVKGGIRARAWEVLFTTNVRIRRFDIADSIDEIMREES